MVLYEKWLANLPNSFANALRDEGAVLLPKIAM
jgi:hypothetical protein